jgi:hypothetical protein
MNQLNFDDNFKSLFIIFIFLDCHIFYSAFIVKFILNIRDEKHKNLGI